jgi:iron-sulfur cluster repair protein YtfE (RIC family)
MDNDKVADIIARAKELLDTIEAEKSRSKSLAKLPGACAIVADIRIRHCQGGRESLEQLQPLQGLDSHPATVF